MVEVSVFLYCHLLPVGLCISDITYYSSKLQFMLALIEHSPDIYLDEIQEQLLERHDVKLTLYSILRTLKRLGMSSKKVSILILR